MEQTNQAKEGTVKKVQYQWNGVAVFLTERQYKILEDAVVAIRKDPKIGVGTCSMVDECLTDNELRDAIGQLLVNDSARSVAGVVRQFRKQDALFWERGNEIKAEVF